MPRGRSQSAESDAGPSRSSLTPESDQDAITALSIPDDIKADLLRQQGESVETPQALPMVKVMPAGAGLYDIEGEATPVREFYGVILNNHARNVLWDRKYGVEVEDEELKRAACSSNDGRWGTPREGFAHPALEGEVGNGVRMVACQTCPLNRWGSGATYIADKNPKGKACTNQRSVYIMVEGRETPLELRLPPTSLNDFDAYLTDLLNKGVPVQAVVTKFSQKIMGTNARFGKAVFEVAEALSPEGFQAVLTKRARYHQQITPQVIQEAAVIEDSETGDGLPNW